MKNLKRAILFFVHKEFRMQIWHPTKLSCLILIYQSVCVPIGIHTDKKYKYQVSKNAKIFVTITDQFFFFKFHFWPIYFINMHVIKKIVNLKKNIYLKMLSDINKTWFSWKWKSDDGYDNNAMVVNRMDIVLNIIIKSFS